MKRKIPEHIPEELERAGAEVLEYGMGGKHPYVRFRIVDQIRKFTFPGSESDWRSMKNNRTQLKRLIRATLEMVNQQPKPA